MSRWYIVYLPIALLTVPAAPANAQPASFQGPIVGFVFSGASKTVRPLLGIPGATHAAPPILSRVDSASIAPGGKWAFITRAGHAGFVSGLSDMAPAESSIGGAGVLIDAVDRVVWSRDGSFALLYSSSRSRLQRVQLSGNQPLADGPIDLSPWGIATTLAIDPAGQQIAAGFAASGLYLFTALSTTGVTTGVTTGQSPALLSSMAQPAAATFDGTGKFLFAIDKDTQRIVQFQIGSGLSEFASLVQTEVQTDGPALDPAGLAVSGDGRYLLLADSATRSVFVYEIDSRTLANTIPLNFAPSRFEALSAGPVFLLNGNRGKEWLLILDASQVPVVYFVPANVEERL
jgi:DNA-binding beta-propeller fold protein YncE